MDEKTLNVTVFFVGAGSIALTLTQSQMDYFLAGLRDNRNGIIYTPLGGFVIRHVTHWRVD